MSTLVDSEAHFEGRLRELGTITAVKNHAMECQRQPGRPLVDAVIDAFCKVR